MTRPRLLIVSNGHGEDVLGALLAKTIMGLTDQLQLSAYPLVGKGRAYRRAGVDVVGVQQKMPTGGLTTKGRWIDAYKDFRAGLVGLIWRQTRDLKKRKHEIDYVVAVGDILALWLAGRYLKRPLVFVPTAKSEYINGHLRIEYWLMRHYAMKIFPRDQKTNAAMKARGLPSDYVGNLMMDGFNITQERLGMNTDTPVVALLPGSRADAYANACDLIRVGKAMKREAAVFRLVMPVADGLEPEVFDKMAVEEGVRLHCFQGRFGDVIQRADIVIGLAGTANEQAAGMGKPVVTFVGSGSQCSRKFFMDQQKLLGESVTFVDSDDESVPYERIAEEAVDILQNEHRYKLMSEAGRERMGGPGAAQKMSEAIVDLVQLNKPSR